VKFLGTVAHRRMHQIYRQADILVCPSQKHEAFGLVNVEALSAGLPVIASDIGGIREIVIQGWNGLLVPEYTNPHAFAEAIIFLVRNPQLLRSMGVIARLDCLSRFSWSATAGHLSQLYENWPNCFPGT
jgi:spore coat protein SA